jgi:hypothetical protein
MGGHLTAVKQCQGVNDVEERTEKKVLVIYIIMFAWFTDLSNLGHLSYLILLNIIKFDNCYVVS